MQVIIVMLALPVVVPVLPEHTAVSTGIAKIGFQKDEIAWPELARSVDAAWRALPPAVRRDSIVVADNYGEAPALERYGHVPGVSGHLSWQYWRPRLLPQHHVLLVGFDGSHAWLCARSHVVARIDNHAHLDNEERGRTIARCTLRRSLGDERPRIATFNL